MWPVASRLRQSYVCLPWFLQTRIRFDIPHQWPKHSISSASILLQNTVLTTYKTHKETMPCHLLLVTVSLMEIYWILLVLIKYLHSIKTLAFALGKRAKFPSESPKISKKKLTYSLILVYFDSHNAQLLHLWHKKCKGYKTLCLKKKKKKKSFQQIHCKRNEIGTTEKWTI